MGGSRRGPSKGTGTHHGSRGSPCAITFVASRTSRTSRQIAPWTEMTWARRPRSAEALGLNAGIRPKVGFTVATPHAKEG